MMTQEFKKGMLRIIVTVLVLASIAILLLTKPTITGLTIIDSAVFNETSAIDFGAQINSLKITGSAQGKGIVQIYLGDALVANVSLPDEETNATVIDFENNCIETCATVNASSQLRAEINGTMLVLLSGFNYTLAEPIQEQNITEIRERITNETVQNKITVYTDKARYLSGEIINIFGDVIIEEQKTDTNITITITLNENTTFSTQLTTLNNSYNYYFTQNLEQEGIYDIQAFAGNISGQTIFYFSKDNATTNKTNVTLTELRTDQGKAEAGKPVKWKKYISVEKDANVRVENKTLAIEVPEFAENIVLRDLTNVQEEKIKIIPPQAFIFQTNTAEKPTKKISWTEKEIPYNLTIGYILEYETPAPIKEEKDNYEGRLGQKLIVVKNTASVHYSNVTVSINISQNKNLTIIPNKNMFSSKDTPEFQIHAGAGLRLLWINGTEALFNKTTDVTTDEKHNATFTDDTLSWTVPQLSQQTYIVEPIQGNFSNITNAFVEDAQGNFFVQAEITNNSFGDIVIKVPIVVNVVSGEYTIVIVTADNQTYKQQFYWWLTENLQCKDFEELVLWSSGYSDKEQGSTNYHTWTPSSNCAEFGNQTCFIGNVETEARFLYFGENNTGEGYVQIAKLNESTCQNPLLGTYSTYIARENLYGETKKLNQFCGNSTNQVCGAKIPGDNGTIAQCYGIKSSASQYMIVDVFKIKYFLCGEKNV